MEPIIIGILTGLSVYIFLFSIILLNYIMKIHNHINNTLYKIKENIKMGENDIRTELLVFNDLITDYIKKLDYIGNCVELYCKYANDYPEENEEGKKRDKEYLNATATWIKNTQETLNSSYNTMIEYFDKVIAYLPSSKENNTEEK